MDGLSTAASVIAAIQLTGSLVMQCWGYFQEVKGARDEIQYLQRTITGLQGTLQDLERLLRSDGTKALPTSSKLDRNIEDCSAELQALETRLDSGKRKKLMRKVGLRALKWPLKRSEMESVIQKLEGYKSLFIVSLNVDQTYVPQE
jgi:uncharacterized protein Yka (UPF0111/DUF47 family)